MKRFIAMTVLFLTFAATAEAAPLDVRRTANRAERAYAKQWNSNPVNLRARAKPGLPGCVSRSSVANVWRCRVGLLLVNGSCTGRVYVVNGFAGQVRMIRCVA